MVESEMFRLAAHFHLAAEPVSGFVGELVQLREELYSVSIIR